MFATVYYLTQLRNITWFLGASEGAEWVEMCCVCVRYLKTFSSPAVTSTLTPLKSTVKLFCSKNTSSMALNINVCVNGVFQCVWFPFCIAEFHISAAALTTPPRHHGDRASWQPSKFPQSRGLWGAKKQQQLKLDVPVTTSQIIYQGGVCVLVY